MSALSLLAEAAAKIRAAVREAGAERDLPPYPPQARFRVLSSRTAHSVSIDIYVENVPHSWLIEQGTVELRSEPSLLLGSVLLEIAERYFTADGTISFLGVHFHVAEGE